MLNTTSDAAAVSYVDLGNVWANDINNFGQVVGGYFGEDGLEHGFVTGANGVGLTDIGSLGGATVAVGVNDTGQVVGMSRTANQLFRAFSTGPNGSGISDLGVVGTHNDFWGASWSVAYDVNNSGQVVGKFLSSDGEHAFLTTQDGGFVDLCEGADHLALIQRVGKKRAAL